MSCDVTVDWRNRGRLQCFQEGGMSQNGDLVGQTTHTNPKAENADMASAYGRSGNYGVNYAELYHTDPSGTFWQCNGKAIGSGSEGADTSLQEHYSKDMTLEEAETLALSTLKQVMEEKVTPNNVDIAKVAPTYHLYSPKEVEAVIARL
ncbi:hypothetical protein L7F22_061403 [Adiantum nelumboides]|nr:hypothetical protein [Adiantum nelumboides]